MISKYVPASPKTLLNIPTAQGQLDTFHPIGFKGYRLDKASGCYLLGNGYRMYNPVMRAFYSPDSQSPFGVGGSAASSTVILTRSTGLTLPGM